MRQSLTQQWYIPAIRGAFSILFGILPLTFPGLTLATLVYLFAAYAIIDGVTTLYQSLTNRSDNTQWRWGLLEGGIALIAGVGAFFLPLVTGVALLFLIAFYAIFTGIAQIVSAVRLRKEIENEFWLGLAGLSSVVFGTFIVFDPLGGAVATAWLIGLYAIAFGGAMIGFAFRLRSDNNQNDEDIYTQDTNRVANSA
jgi:uncharacterized membrane protein HdeD (DUF308 family)